MLDATPSSPLPGFRTYVRMLSALTRTQHLSEEFAQALLEQYARAGMLVEYVDVLCSRVRARQQEQQAQAANKIDYTSPSSLLANADFGWEIVEEHASSIEVIAYVRFENGRVEQSHVDVIRGDWYVFATLHGLELCEGDEQTLCADIASWFERGTSRYRNVVPVSRVRGEAA